MLERFDLLHEARVVDWAAYAAGIEPSESEYYHPEDVPVAFWQLLSAADEREGRAAYDAMLWAIGNNSAGLLYPAAVPATPLIVRIARECDGWVRWAALDILIEFTSFGVDSKRFVSPTGELVDFRESVYAAIHDLRDDLVAMAQAPGDGIPTGRSAAELLRIILR